MRSPIIHWQIRHGETSHILQNTAVRPETDSVLAAPISPLHDHLCACICALELDAVTAAAAHQLLRTCHAASSPTDTDIAVLAASLLVAVKAQNGDRKLRDIINVVHAAVRPDSPPLTIGPEFWSLRDAVVLMEQRLLRACAFQVEFDASQLQVDPSHPPTGTPAMRAHSPVSACQYLDGAQPAAKLLPTCVGHSYRLQQMRNAPSHPTRSFEIGGVTLIVRPQPTLVQASHPMRIAAALECARLMCGLQLQPIHCCWCVYT
jgi:hypothetical protein